MVSLRYSKFFARNRERTDTQKIYTPKEKQQVRKEDPKIEVVEFVLHQTGTLTEFPSSIIDKSKLQREKTFRKSL